MGCSAPPSPSTLSWIQATRLIRAELEHGLSIISFLQQLLFLVPPEAITFGEIPVESFGSVTNLERISIQRANRCLG